MALGSSLPPESAQSTNEAKIESVDPECSESSIMNVDTSGVNSDVDRENTLEFAEELTVKGHKASKENDYAGAAEYFSRALEIRTAHYGELAPDCINVYYQYDLALLCKAQEDADPVGSVPKKDAGSQQESDKVSSAKTNVNGESSLASVSNYKAEREASSNQQEGPTDDGFGGEEDGDKDDENDAEDAGEAEEDESDLDLAWKMFDLARAIAEKHACDSMEMVDTLSALAEVALEREDFEISFGNYLKALNLLEQLVEPDSRPYFKICLCLEIGSKPQEAIAYCQRAISILKSRVQRLTDEVNNLSRAQLASSAVASEVVENMKQCSDISQTGDSNSKKAEIKYITVLFGDMEKKLEDLQHLTSIPKSVLFDLLESVAAKANGNTQTAPPRTTGGSSSRIGSLNGDEGFESPTGSTGHTNATSIVTHLGTVGRGVKRVGTTSGIA